MGECLIKSNFKIKISVTTNLICVVCFISLADVIHNLTICVACRVSNERVKLLTLREHVCPIFPFFDRVSVAHLFSFQRCVLYFGIACLRTVYCVPDGLPIFDSFWFLMGSVMIIFLVFCVVLCIFALFVCIQCVVYPMDCPF